MPRRPPDKLQDVRFVEEKKLVQKFLGEVNRPNGLAVYGLPKIIDALNRSNMETILISDDINITKIKMTCKNCQTVKEKVVENQKKMQTMQQMLSEPCSKCGATDYEIGRVGRRRHARGEGHPDRRQGRDDILRDGGGSHAEVVRRGRRLSQVQDLASSSPD